VRRAVVVGPAHVEVKLDSTPPEAAIYQNGKFVGNAPLTVSVPKGQKTKFTMRLSGYDSETVVVDGSKPLEARHLSVHRATTTNPDLKGIDDDGLAPPSR
jgi:hypothetical protein